MLHKYNYLLIRNISTTCTTDYSYNGYRILKKNQEYQLDTSHRAGKIQ